MREILFRGKDVDNGAWVYGFYIAHLPYTPSVFENNAEKAKEQYEKDTKHLIAHDGFNDWNMPRSLKVTDIKKETVGQYTGLKDDSGKRIFEGDIIEMPFDSGKSSLRAQVLYSEDEAYFFLNGVAKDKGWKGHYEYGNPLFVFQKVCHITIVGNIHDNPELLTEGAANG